MGTHEIYVRLPNEFDYEDFFQGQIDVNESVLEKKFIAHNLTAGHIGEDVSLKFVYYVNSNQEKRIPSLGEIFKNNNVQENDVVRLESRIDNGIADFYITFLRPTDITLNPRQFYYSINKNDEQDSNKNLTHIDVDNPLQQIFYGAPGTGKSYKVKEETKEWEKKGRVVRTTFHPDSDYSTFVGAYKPTMEKLPVRDSTGKFITSKGDTTYSPKETDVLLLEKQITYSFVPQAFLQAYVDAWTNRDEPEFLIIEEINRGNCAQIFGDLFQLLDRGDDGFADNAIRADKDLQNYLATAFENVAFDEKYQTIKEGKKLLLPKNLYIWATMNTSDQSLFPIDSAFKRRWDWQYVPIHDVRKNYKIEVNGELYDWWEFLTKINARIYDTTNSEDKQLGYFFCKATKCSKGGNEPTIITANTFVSKVLFYIWNDVFKDYEYDNDAFDDDVADKDAGKKSHKIQFKDFYSTDADGKTIVVTRKIKQFFGNLEMYPYTIEDENDDEEETLEPDAQPTPDTNERDYSEFSLNGEGRFRKKMVAEKVMRKFIEDHQDFNEEEIKREWDSLGNIVPRLVQTSSEYNDFISISNDEKVKRRFIVVPLKKEGQNVYVSNQFRQETIDKFIERMHRLNWPYRIERIRNEDSH